MATARAWFAGLGLDVEELPWGAAATAAGSVALIVLVLFIVATGQVNTGTPPPVLVALSLLSFFLWYVGSVVFALGLMRANAISPIAGWLLILGAVGGSVALIAGGQNPPPIFYLPLVLYGIGWVLVGYAARTAADLGTAARTS